MMVMWVMGGVVLRSNFFPAPPTPPLTQKIYTHRSAQHHILVGKVVFVNLSIMSNEDIQAFCVGAGIAIIYSLRKREPFTTIWAFISAFFMVLLCILMLGFIGNGIKNWWKK